MKTSLCVLFVALFQFSLSHAAIYTVAQTPTASDDNPGSKDKPFLTIGKAALVAKSGDTVRIESGTYRESVLLNNSGTKEKPIVFEAVKPGGVVITGAIPLKGWKKENNTPAYSIPWAHDFFANEAKGGLAARIRTSKNNQDGSKGALEIYCAEEFLWNGRPLRQVLKPDKLAPGFFFVDWDKHILYVRLPGDKNPNEEDVLGAVNDKLFAPADWKQAKVTGRFTTAQYITIRGIVFRYAANFAQSSMVTTSHGWCVEDCVFEWANAGGFSAKGGDCTVLRCIARDNGHMGISAHDKNNVIKDCTVCRNNWKGYRVSWEAGGGKYCGTDGLQIINMKAYDNVGHGIWLDVDNINFHITGCVSHGNLGQTIPGQGSGIFIEISLGPGRIDHNLCYGNTGAGVALAESTGITVEDNVLVDNGAGIGLRDMDNRPGDYHLRNLVIHRNSFKSNHDGALRTSSGHWDLKSAKQKGFDIDENIYDPPGKAIFAWGKDSLSFDEARKSLGVEPHGKIAPVSFSKGLVQSKTAEKQAPVETIEKALTAAHAGDTVTIPVVIRTALKKSADGWTCSVHDHADSSVALKIPGDALKVKIDKAIPEYPLDTPIHLVVQMGERQTSGDKQVRVIKVIAENNQKE